MGVPAVAQWVKDLALSRLWRRSQLQFRFDPSSGNFHMPQVQPPQKKRAVKKTVRPSQDKVVAGGSGSRHLARRATRGSGHVECALPAGTENSKVLLPSSEC